MARFAMLILVAVLLVTAEARAVILLLLRDEFDDRQTVSAVSDVQAVKDLRQQMDQFTMQLQPLKERDIVALFGKPTQKPAKTFAMPVAQARGLGLSGLRYADPKLNKDHTDFYTIADFAGIEVYYAIDGVSPAAILLYLRADETFPRLTKDNLGKRLLWEQERLKKLTEFFEKRRVAVFEWEVDAEQARKMYQGLASGDFTVKVEAMLLWGKEQGFRLDYRPAKDEQTPRWSWYQGDKLMAEAYHGRGFKGVEGKPCEFLFYGPDGTRLRDEGGWPSLDMIRWYRLGGTMVRYEGGSVRDGIWRPTTWCWYDKKQNAIRSEWDDNGDGIPDAYREGAFYEREPQLPLILGRSWAVYPDLIPEENRIPDQPNRRVPIRKIVP